MSSAVRVRRATTDADLAEAMRVRLTVFVDEQGVPPELEPDEYDAVALHLVALAPDADTIVGTARVVEKDGGIAKIGRVAVLAAYRGQGVGAALMRAALRLAEERGLAVAALDAQVPVIAFYEQLGFVAEGPIFDDAGIPHRHMRRPLTP